MLSAGHRIKEAWVVIPILLLLFAGCLIAVRSGVERRTSGLDVRQIIRTFWRVLLRLAGYVAVLLALQYWIGLRPSLGW
jgi:hypothetical protein